MKKIPRLHNIVYRARLSCYWNNSRSPLRSTYLFLLRTILNEIIKMKRQRRTCYVSIIGGLKSHCSLTLFTSKIPWEGSIKTKKKTNGISSDFSLLEYRRVEETRTAWSGEFLSSQSSSLSVELVSLCWKFSVIFLCSSAPLFLY